MKLMILLIIMSLSLQAWCYWPPNCLQASKKDSFKNIIAIEIYDNGGELVVRDKFYGSTGEKQAYFSIFTDLGTILQNDDQGLLISYRQLKNFTEVVFEETLLIDFEKEQGYTYRMDKRNGSNAVSQRIYLRGCTRNNY